MASPSSDPNETRVVLPVVLQRRSTKLAVTLSGDNHIAAVDFVWNGRPGWAYLDLGGSSHAHRARFLRLFCAYYSDPGLVERFGVMHPDDDCWVGHAHQRQACVLQAVRDVFACIDQCIEQKRHAAMGYAVWHLDSTCSEEAATYEDYIADHAVQCIVHNTLVHGDTDLGARIRFQGSLSTVGTDV